MSTQNLERVFSFVDWHCTPDEEYELTYNPDSYHKFRLMINAMDMQLSVSMPVSVIKEIYSEAAIAKAKKFLAELS